MIGLFVGITMAIIMLVIIFSVFPMITGALTAGVVCPAITGDTNSNYVQDTGENWTGDAEANTWSANCNNIKGQMLSIPIVVVVAVVIGSLLLVTRMFGFDSFGGSDDNEETATLPKGYTTTSTLPKGYTASKPVKKKSFGQKMRWFVT